MIGSESCTWSLAMTFIQVVPAWTFTPQFSFRKSRQYGDTGNFVLLRHRLLMYRKTKTRSPADGGWRRHRDRGLWSYVISKRLVGHESLAEIFGAYAVDSALLEPEIFKTKYRRQVERWNFSWRGLKFYSLISVLQPIVVSALTLSFEVGQKKNEFW